MKHAVIGRFYKKVEDAVKEQQRMEGLYKRRVRFCVLSYLNGNLVISESAMRKCFPHLFERKVGTITKNNYKGKLNVA